MANWVRIADGTDINLEKCIKIEYLEDIHEKKRDKRYYIKFHFDNGKEEEITFKRKAYYRSINAIDSKLTKKTIDLEKRIIFVEEALRHLPLLGASFMEAKRDYERLSVHHTN